MKALPKKTSFGVAWQGGIGDGWEAGRRTAFKIRLWAWKMGPWAWKMRPWA